MNDADTPKVAVKTDRGLRGAARTACWVFTPDAFASDLQRRQ